MTTSPRVLQTTTVALIMTLLLGVWPRTSIAVPGFLRSEVTRPFSPLTAGTPAVFQPGETSQVVPLGFSFEFYGETYTHVNVSSFGSLIPAQPCVATSSAAGQCPGNSTCGASNTCEASLLSSAPSQNPALPQPTTGQPVIAALWDDVLTSPGAVTYRTEGSSPNRTFTVQWSQVRRAPVSSSHATFQIRLQESSNSIEFHYGPFNYVFTEATMWSATMGIQDAAGLDGDTPFRCADTRSCNGDNLRFVVNKVVRWAIPQTAELCPEPALGSTFPLYARAGDSLSVPFSIKNLGLATTTTTVAYVIRLTGRTNTVIAQDILPAIPAGNTVTATAIAILPLVPADYYSVEVEVDPNNQILETSIANNDLELKRNLLIGSELSAAVVAPNVANPGDVVTFVVNITNTGAAEADVPVSIYLSPSPTSMTSSVSLGTVRYGVPAGGREIQMPLVMPAHPTGTYYAFVSLDIVDAQPGNNQTFAPTSTHVLDPDLLVQSVDTPIPMAVHGEPFSVEATIENTGAGGAVGFFVRAFFSDNTSCTSPTHTLPDNSLPLDLASHDTLRFQHTYLVPSDIPLGTYYVCLSANPDQRMPEGNPYGRNTRSTTNPIIVYEPLPDFAILDLQAPSVIAAGEPMALHRTLINLGQGADTMQYQVFLSPDNILDRTQDCLLGTSDSPTTHECRTTGISTRPYTPQSEVSEVERIMVPTLDPGQYYVIYSLDPNNAHTELDETNNIASAGPITLVANGLQIITDELPLGMTSVPYEVTLATRGHVELPDFSVSQGTLPPGLELSVSGHLNGTPADAGDFDFVVGVFDGHVRAHRAFSLTIIAPTTELQIATRSLPPALVGVPIETPLIPLGGTPPYSWQVVTGTTPPGLAIDAQGWLRGTATEAGLETIEVLLRDRFDATAQAELVVRAVTADGSVRWSSMTLPDGELGEVYEQDLEPQPGTGVAPFEYDLVGGELPPGLQLGGDCYELVCGTPTQSGAYSFDLRISDSIGHFDVNRYFIGITDESFSLASSSLPDAVVGEPYRTVIETSGGAATFAVLTGELPKGLELNAEGILTGVPEEAGLQAIVVVAHSGGASAYAAYSLLVVQAGALPSPLLVDAPEPQGCRCTATSNTQPWHIVLLGLLIVGFRRRRIGLVLLLLMVGTASPAMAQLHTTYSVHSQAMSYTHLTGGSRLTFSPDSDDGDALVDLPFLFPFYGVDYAQVRVGSNGLIAMGNALARSPDNSQPPTSMAPNGIIVPWWDDLVATDTSTHTRGRRPNRTFVIQYGAVTKAGVTNAGQFQFQVRLFENRSGHFDVHYGPITGSSAPQSTYSASTGFEDSTGTRGQDLLGCPNGCDSSDLSRATNTVVQVRPDVGTDLIALDIVGPTHAIGAGIVNVDIALESFTHAGVGPVEYAIHLVPRGAQPDASTEILRSAPTAFTAFERKDLTVPVTIPSTTTQGSYTFAVVVDAGNQVLEHDEINNTVVAAAGTRVRVAAPNFRVDHLSAASQADQGGLLPVTFELENNGPVPGETNWHIMLSANRVVSGQDYSAMFEDKRFAANEGPSTLRRTVTIPRGLPPGRYWLGVILDPLDAVSELNELDNSAVFGPITILGDVASVDPRPAPRGYVGLSYVFDLMATGGDGVYTWSVVGGAQELPAGLRLEDNQVLGIPEQSGTSTVTFEVTSDGQLARIEQVLTMGEPVNGLTILTRNLEPGVVGAEYPGNGSPSQGIVAVGGQGPVRFHVQASGLASPQGDCGGGELSSAGAPAGLTLDLDGVLFGTPQTAGDFEILVVATDDRESTARCVNLTLSESGRLTLVADSLPEGKICERYRFDFRAVGGSSTTTASFRIIGPDTAPPGLVVESRGSLRGQPTQLGRNQFVVEVSDGIDSDTAGFLLNVVECSAEDLTPLTLPNAQVGVPYHVELDAPELEIGREWTVAGDAWPKGLSSYAVPTGRYIINGTPEEAGSATFLAQAEDDEGGVARLGYRLQVDEAPPPPPLDEGCQCTSTGQLSSAWLLSGLLLLLRRRKPAFRA